MYAKNDIFFVPCFLSEKSNTSLDNPIGILQVVKRHWDLDWINVTSGSGEN